MQKNEEKKSISSCLSAIVFIYALWKEREKKDLAIHCHSPNDFKSEISSGKEVDMI